MAAARWQGGGLIVTVSQLRRGREILTRAFVRGADQRRHGMLSLRSSFPVGLEQPGRERGP